MYNRYISFGFFMSLILIIAACGESKVHNIFVYGSLREGFDNYNKYLKGKVSNIRPGIVQGQLFHIADRGYPALLEGNNDVYGEIMTITKNYKDVLQTLDELECFYGEGIISNEYNRKKVEVLNITTGEKEQLPVYFFNTNNPEIEGLQFIFIPDGDWKNYIKNKNML